LIGSRLYTSLADSVMLVGIKYFKASALVRHFEFKDVLLILFSFQASKFFSPVKMSVHEELKVTGTRRAGEKFPDFASQCTLWMDCNDMYKENEVLSTYSILLPFSYHHTHTTSSLPS
jgi:hypothetical protein